MTSAMGQSEVMSSISPTCDLLGHPNEAEVIVGGVRCTALVDTGSMVTSIGETFYKEHLEDKYPLMQISDLLKVEGAGGHQLSYSGYVELDISVPEHSPSPLWVPALVAPATAYNSRVPLIVGTNIIKHLQSCKQDDVWSSAINAITAQQSIPEDVAVYCCRQMVIPPYGTVNFRGRIGAQTGIKTGVLEPATSLPGGIMLFQAVVSPDEANRVQVVLKNVTARSMEIPRRQRVAVLQQSTVLEPSQSSPQLEPQVEESGIPVHLDESCVSEGEKEQVQQMLCKWREVFAFTSSELGLAKGVKHRIVLSDPVPFKDRPRRIPPGMYEEVKLHLKDMLACGAIRPSSSPYSSGVVLVRKKDGSLRLCLDFRKINNKTLRDAYFLPKIEETLDHLQGARWFSSLDLQAGYWQVELEEEDKPKTAFSVGGNLGFYECNRMPFGLTNAPATFQRLMEQTLKDLPNCFAYLDDIIIYSSGSVEDHLAKLEAVFKRLLECGLKLKPSKCSLLMKRIKYLGHVVSEQGAEADPEKVEKVRTWPLPTTIQELRQALGFFGYYRRFVKDFSKLAKPLHKLLQGVENKSRVNKNTPVEMNQEAISAFELLKSKLTSPPILAFANYNLPFRLHTDASSRGLGAVLYQEQEGKMRVIAYASRGLKPSEVNYPAHKLEFLALKWSVCEKFQDYLYGNQFEVYTDSNPMSYVLTSAKLDATGHRWLAELSLYNFSIHYRPGTSNGDADGMSRLPTTSPDNEQVIDRAAIEAICHGVKLQDACYAETLGVSSRVQEYEQDVFPRDSEFEKTASEWRKQQMEDPILQQLIPIVESGVKPDLASVDSDVQPYIREWDRLCLFDGVLYRSRIDPDHDSEVHQLVLPASEREQALHGLHDDMGHLGRDRTLQLVRSRFFWPKMAEDVKTKVQTCPACVRRKSSGIQRAPLVNIITTQPMELVSVDFLSLEPSKGGIENILVITDHFTRLARATPCRNQTAKTTAQALYSFFMDYGFPLKLLSDQGRNFESQTIKELCKLCGIQKSRTTPYHPMGNGKTERFNSTLLGMLGCLTHEQKADWKKYVSSLVHAYNATRHDSTGYSPFFLMFGRHPRLAIDVAMGIVPKDELGVDFTRGLQERLDVAYKLANAQQEKSASRYKTNYDRKIRGSTVDIGDRVLVKNVSIRGKHKLANIWGDDVYVVLEQPNQDIPVFVVRREDSKGSKRILHRNLLLPVNFLPLSPKLLESKPMKKDTLQKPKIQDRSSSHSSSDSDSDSDTSVHEERYSLRSRLNPAAQEFVPGEAANPIVHQEEELQGLDIAEAPIGEDVFEAEAEILEEADDEDAEVLEPLHLPVMSPSPERRHSHRERHQPLRYGHAVSHLVHVGDKEERMWAMRIMYLDLLGQ